MLYGDRNHFPLALLGAAGPLLVPAKPPQARESRTDGTLAAARPGTLRHSSTKLPALTYLPTHLDHGLTAQIILP